MLWPTMAGRFGQRQALHSQKLDHPWFRIPLASIPNTYVAMCSFPYFRIRNAYHTNKLSS